MLKGRNIWKSYDGLEVLRGIDVDIEASSITSVVGKSGAGKSTLLHILGTLDAADKGEIIIDGKEVVNLSGQRLAAFRNQTLGFVFQFHHLIPEFSALENICIPAFIAKKTKKEAEMKAEQLLDYMGLSPRRNHKPSELSGGEQQRVAIARALVNNPKLVFADEPTGNLDTQTSSDIHHLFLNLKEELNQTFLIATHNVELAELSDFRLEMKDGLFC